MELNKTENASRNIYSGVALHIYQLLIPFAVRTIMMYTIGIGYLGLNGLFTSIFTVLNLTELGVDSAMVFSMYKPIAENDKDKICALMRLYRFYYRIIGIVILVLGLLLLPALKLLIAGEIPSDINIYYLYLISLASVVCSYWLFSYRNCLLNAHQRNDVHSKVTIVTDTICFILQAVSLVLTRNYYYFIIVPFFIQILNNVIVAYYSKRIYPQYGPVGKLSKEETKIINQKIKDLFTAKLGYTLAISVDAIVISAFLGLKILAQYQNYYLIMTSVMGFITIVFTSITAGVGNSLITKSKEENYKEFEILTLIVTWICIVCCSCFMSLYQPFIEIWMGKDMLLDIRLVGLLCLYFVLYEFLMMISVYKDAGGIWHEDRYRPLISSVTNLIINIVLVNFIGLFGIVLSTIISILFISLPWIISNVFRLIFKKDKKGYVIKMLINFVSIALSTFVAYLCCSLVSISGIPGLLVRLLISVGISALIILVLYRLDKNYKAAINMLLKVSRIDRIMRDKSILIDAGVFAFFIFTMVFKLTHSSPWGDEWVEYTYSKASLLNGDLLHNVISTFQPPLYNLIMHFWLMVSDNLLWFRMFNVLIGFVTGIFLYKTAEKLFGKWTARITILLLSVTFRWVYFVQECSEYLLMVMFLSVALYFYVLCFEKFSYKRFIGFILSIVGALYSQYGSFFVAVPLLVLFLVGNLISKKVTMGQKMVVSISYFVSFVIFALPLYFVFASKQLNSNEIGKHTEVPGLDFVSDLFIVPGRILGYFYNVKFEGIFAIGGVLLTIISMVMAFLIVRNIRKDWTKSSLVLGLVCTFVLHYILVKLHIYAMVNPTLSEGFYTRYSVFYIPILALCIPVFVGTELKYIPNKLTKCATYLLVVFALVMAIHSVRVIIPNWDKAKDRQYSEIWLENKGWEDTTLLFGTAEYGFNYYVTHSDEYQDGYLRNVTMNYNLDNLPDHFWCWRTNWLGDGWQEVVDRAVQDGYDVTIYDDSGYIGQLAYCSK